MQPSHGYVPTIQHAQHYHHARNISPSSSIHQHSEVNGRYGPPSSNYNMSNTQLPNLRSMLTSNEETSSFFFDRLSSNPTTHTHAHGGVEVNTHRFAPPHTSPFGKYKYSSINETEQSPKSNNNSPNSSKHSPFQPLQTVHTMVNHEVGSNRSYDHQFRPSYSPLPQVISERFIPPPQSHMDLKQRIAEMDERIAELEHQLGIKQHTIEHLEIENYELRKELAYYQRYTSMPGEPSNVPTHVPYAPPVAPNGGMEPRKHIHQHINPRDRFVSQPRRKEVADMHSQPIQSALGKRMSPSDTVVPIQKKAKQTEKVKSLSIVDESESNMRKEPAIGDIEEYKVSWQGETYVLVNAFKNRTQILNYFVPLYQNTYPDKPCKLVLCNDEYKQLSTQNPHTVEKKKHAWRVSVFTIDFYNFVKNYQKTTNPNQFIPTKVTASSSSKNNNSLSTTPSTTPHLPSPKTESSPTKPTTTLHHNPHSKIVAVAVTQEYTLGMVTPTTNEHRCGQHTFR